MQDTCKWIWLCASLYNNTVGECNYFTISCLSAFLLLQAKVDGPSFGDNVMIDKDQIGSSQCIKLAVWQCCAISKCVAQYLVYCAMAKVPILYRTRTRYLSNTKDWNWKCAEDREQEHFIGQTLKGPPRNHRIHKMITRSTFLKASTKKTTFLLLVFS